MIKRNDRVALTGASSLCGEYRGQSAQKEPMVANESESCLNVWELLVVAALFVEQHRGNCCEEEATDPTTVTQESP